MIDRRDRQRSKVYAWEERFVVPHDPSLVAFAHAQGMVDAIWADMGLRFPPKVERLPRQARCTLADASRLSIRLADHNPSWCLLHELAHAMSSTHDERSDGHGPKATFACLRMRSPEPSPAKSHFHEKYTPWSVLTAIARRRRAGSNRARCPHVRHGELLTIQIGP